MPESTTAASRNVISGHDSRKHRRANAFATAVLATNEDEINSLFSRP